MTPETVTPAPRTVTVTNAASAWRGMVGHVVREHTDPVTGDVTVYVRFGPDEWRPALPFGAGEVREVAR